MVKRRTIWATFNSEEVLLAAVGIAQVSLRTLILSQRPGLGEYTITRTIGNIYIRGNSTSRGEVKAGLITTAATAGVGGTPDPHNEPQADWMYYRSGLSPLAGVDIPNWWDWSFDLASQRKQGEFERDWVLMLANRGANAINFMISGRTLLKL